MLDTLPWFVAFTYNGTDYVKMWFGDQWFSDQYDEHEIVVLPALPNVDDFWLAGNVVKQKLELNDLVEHSRRVQELRGGFPPTIVETEMFLYYDPQNPRHTEKTYWTTLGYGPDSNNIDYRKDALVEYILTNSTHSREEWMTILPDLFRRSEVLRNATVGFDRYSKPRRLMTEAFIVLSVTCDSLCQSLRPSLPTMIQRMSDTLLRRGRIITNRCPFTLSPT